MINIRIYSNRHVMNIVLIQSSVLVRFSFFGSIDKHLNLNRSMKLPQSIIGNLFWPVCEVLLIQSFPNLTTKIVLFFFFRVFKMFLKFKCKWFCKNIDLLFILICYFFTIYNLKKINLKNYLNFKFIYLQKSNGDNEFIIIIFFNLKSSLIPLPIKYKSIFWIISDNWDILFQGWKKSFLNIIFVIWFISI